MSHSKVTKRAVLVGCNYPYSKFRLSGCANDVQSIKDVIMDKFGFHSENIHVLTDDKTSSLFSSHSLPTGANIKAALNDMLKNAAPGDVLFFYFSGHGTAVPVLVPGKHFRQDEAIVPCDFNLITDLDFRRLVNRVPEGASFTILSDSCHSGGLIEKEKKQNVFVPHASPQQLNLKAKPKFLVFDFINTAIDAAAGFASNAIDAAAGYAHDGLHKIAEGAHKIFGKDVSLTFHPVQRSGGLLLDPLHEDEGILLSGCDSDETSYDIVSDGKAYGAFTHEVVNILKKMPGSIKIKDLMQKAAEAVDKKGYEQKQNPCLYCSDKNRDELFLGGIY